jgi:hypothetical protein
MPEDRKYFKWDDVSGKMVNHKDGSYMVCYQTKEYGYQPRSFEDDFIATNMDFVKENPFTEKAIKRDYRDGFDTVDDAYDVASKVESKAAFAFEILLHSKAIGKDPFGGWKIPTYIKQGLLWLRK